MGNPTRLSKSNSDSLGERQMGVLKKLSLYLRPEWVVYLQMLESLLSLSFSESVSLSHRLD